jgi:hypothetical protein
VVKYGFLKKIRMVGEAQPELSEGCTVEIFGLVSAAQHNGCKGVLLRFESEKGRWAVKLASDGEVLGVKPANLTFVEGPREEDTVDDEDDEEKFVRAKRKFDQIRVKYRLQDDRVSGEIADLLTGRHGGGSISAEQFATRYGMTGKDAKAFLQFIQMAMVFKTQAMDPHNELAAKLREDLSSS